MKIAKKLIITSVLVALSTPAFAQTASDNRDTEINNRAANQQERIDQGTASGQLTDKEAAHLQKKQDKVEGNITKAESDGTVTKHESKKINKEENHDSKRIHHQKTDKQTQAPASPTTQQ